MAGNKRESDGNDGRSNLRREAIGYLLMGKSYQDMNVLQAARERIGLAIDNTERIYVALSGGKDSSVLLHLVMEQAIQRKRKVAVMFIDFEAQYQETIRHLHDLFD